MSEEKIFPYVYHCLFCYDKIHTSFNKKIVWHASRGDDTTRRRCPQCGKFMVPEALKNELNKDPIVTMDLFYKMFSMCPNAHECHLFDQYGADCEEGVVMPKCIYVLHERLDIAIQLLDELMGKKQPR